MIREFKNVFYLLFILIGGFTASLILDRVFEQLSKDLDQQLENERARLQIGEFIVSDIIYARSTFFQLHSTASSKLRQSLIEDIEMQIKEVNKALEVLQRGGVYKREIELNIVGHKKMIQSITYYPDEEKKKFVVEAISVIPKLDKIKEKVYAFQVILQDKYLILKKGINTPEGKKYFAKLSRFLKTIPPLFTRTIEDINRLRYESKQELNKLHKTIIEQKEEYRRIEMLLFFFIVLLSAYVSFLIARQMHKNMKALQLFNKTLETKIDESVSERLASQKQSRFLLNTVTDAIFTYRKKDGRLSFVNKSMLKLSNHLKKTLLEMSEDTLLLEDIVTDDVKLSRVLEEEKQLKNMGYLQAKEEMIIVSYTKTPFLYEGENFILVMLRDMRYEIEHSLKEKEQEEALIQQSRLAAMGEMIGNIAHQWRQPLNSTGLLLQGILRSY